MLKVIGYRCLLLSSLPRFYLALQVGSDTAKSKNKSILKKNFPVRMKKTRTSPCSQSRCTKGPRLEALNVNHSQSEVSRQLSGHRTGMTTTKVALATCASVELTALLTMTDTMNRADLT